MGLHSDALWELAAELCDSATLSRLYDIATEGPIDYDALAQLDGRIGGPSISTINRGGTGRYEVADRDVFRPLQYCAMMFRNASHRGEIEWRARDIVEMSSLHIEALIKRIGNLFHLPLGAVLRRPVVKARLDAATFAQVERFTRIYNDAKHNMRHNKDTHLFATSDALAAYLVSRKLGLVLYPMAGLQTDIGVFQAADA